MAIRKRQLLTAGKPFQWKVDLRGGGVNEAVAITTAEGSGKVILEFYRTAYADDESLAALDQDDDRQPASIFRWFMDYDNASHWAHNLRTTVREDVYDKRRTKVRFVISPWNDVILTLDRTDIDQLIRAMNEALDVSKPQHGLHVATR